MKWQSGNERLTRLPRLEIACSRCAKQEVLRLNPRTVREYVRRGEVEGRIIGGQWRFRRQELDAFFENAPSEWDFAAKDGHGEQAVERRKPGRGWHGHYTPPGLSTTLLSQYCLLM